MTKFLLWFWRRCALVACSVCLPSGVWAGSLLDALLPQRDLQTVTVTDFTPAGRLRPQPSSEKPVYYVGISGGYRDFGGIKAGEKPVAREVVNSAIMKALAKQGYLPAGEDREPEIFLAWAWGTLSVERIGWSPSFPAVQMNHRQALKFLGGERHRMLAPLDDAFPELSLASGLLFYGGDARSLYDLAMDDLYVAVVSAYAVEDVGGEVKSKLLWNTRISSPARGFYLPDALPAMVAIASSHIGRDTPKPLWIRATDKFKPEIKLGDPTLVEYLETAKVSLVEVGPSK